MGSARSLLFSASLSPHIYIFVNLDASFCLLERRSCGSGTAWWCLVQLSRLPDPLTLHITCKLLHVCISWKSDPSSVALPEVSSIVFIFVYFYPVKSFFFHQHVKFFLTRIKVLRTEDVDHCTDCKAHWGNVIVILGYINKTDLSWFTHGLLVYSLNLKDIVCYCNNPDESDLEYVINFIIMYANIFIHKQKFSRAPLKVSLSLHICTLSWSKS